MIITKEKPLSQIEKERAEQQAPMTTMGQELALLKLENMQKDMVIQALGQHVAMMKIEMMQLKGGES